ncbi:MAG: hypothetical protein R3182_11410, partial [Draconibacterium sp.]|nr:hypothetical protein [Draconibacterium sp.]
MKTNRRKFISNTIAGGLAVTAAPLTSQGSETKRTSNESIIKLRDDKLREIQKTPVLKKELFSSPVIIESLDLLNYENSFICRVRSTDGAEGYSVAHGDMNTYYPIFVRKLQRFFLGKDARDIDLILERILFFSLNFRLNG